METLGSYCTDSLSTCIFSILHLIFCAVWYKTPPTCKSIPFTSRTESGLLTKAVVIFIKPLTTALENNCGIISGCITHICMVLNSRKNRSEGPTDSGTAKPSGPSEGSSFYSLEMKGPSTQPSRDELAT